MDLFSLLDDHSNFFFDTSFSEKSPIEKFQKLKFDVDEDFINGFESFIPNIRPSSPVDRMTFSDLILQRRNKEPMVTKRRKVARRSISPIFAFTRCSNSLTAPVYKTLNEVKFSVHLEDFLEMYKRRSIIPTEVEDEFKVVRFMPCMTELTDSDSYGNVQFSIPIKRLFQKFGSTLNFVGTKALSHAMRSTLTLTAKRSIFHPRYDKTDQYGPLVQKDQVFSSAVACIDKDYTKHELILDVEVTEEDCVWLYNECTVEFTNHSRCLIGSGRRSCFSRSCKSKRTKEETEKYIDEFCPDY